MTPASLALHRSIPYLSSVFDIHNSFFCITCLIAKNNAEMRFKQAFASKAVCIQPSKLAIRLTI